jgi:hypothetical protein
MAKANSTRSTSAIRLDPTTTAEFREMSLRLNEFGLLLAGVEQICEVEDIGGDVLFVVAKVCRQVNESVCKMADRLSALAKEGGAA